MNKKNVGETNEIKKKWLVIIQNIQEEIMVN